MNKAIWIDSDDEREIARQVNTRGRPIVVSYKEAGWPRECNQPGHRLCCSQLKGQCDVLPVWRTVQKGQGYIKTGYYCDAHLNPELRPESKQIANEGVKRR